MYETNISMRLKLIKCTYVFSTEGFSHFSVVQTQLHDRFSSKQIPLRSIDEPRHTELLKRKEIACIQLKVVRELQNMVADLNEC